MKDTNLNLQILCGNICLVVFKLHKTILHIKHDYRNEVFHQYQHNAYMCVTLFAKNTNVIFGYILPDHDYINITLNRIIRSIRSHI